MFIQDAAGLVILASLIVISAACLVAWLVMKSRQENQEIKANEADEARTKYIETLEADLLCKTALAYSQRQHLNALLHELDKANDPVMLPDPAEIEGRVTQIQLVKAYYEVNCPTCRSRFNFRMIKAPAGNLSETLNIHPVCMCCGAKIPFYCVHVIP